MTEPVDDCHAISLDITDRIRRTVMLLKDRAAMWQPGPMPQEWSEHSGCYRHTRRK